MSGKRFFKSRFYKSRFFKSGHWAGVGAATILAPGIEITAQAPRLHWTVDRSVRLDVTAKATRLHYTSEER